MAEGLDSVAVPSIAALPPTTTRQIGSGQVLVDPSSVVKELIDNALDARAKSIFVDTTVNTVDSIQVKDDGHGIPAEDRPLVCRRYCTSKIRDFHDLREVGGKWLGFRGEALSSMADMSGSLSVTTRVEGEPVAVKLKYDRNGELASTEHDSHPVGTTVKVTKFFDFIPVRKETGIKNSAKTLAKIRRLMQAYALARPTIRFRLRVLKAKNSNGDFVYAPKADANIEDAVLKVIGKDCALQCDWTALVANDFEVHAFLPKPGASGPKIAHQGAFVSIDARPVSNSRGTIKRIITTYKERLRKSAPALAGVKDPFFCMNIICPPDSYDPNIEPAKDDVMFDNSEVVVAVVDKLLKAYYPEAIQDIPDIQDAEMPTSAQQQYEPQFEELPSRIESPITIHEHEPANRNEQPTTDPAQALPRWRSSMYGIDEEDLEFLQENPAPVVEEEEEKGLRAVEVSNPWTIARMNTTIKPKQAASNEQLLSPAKSQRGSEPHPSSPSPAITPRRPLSAAPLTPQTLSKTNMRSPLDAELERSIQHVSRPSSEAGILDDRTQERDTVSRDRHERLGPPPQNALSSHFARSDINSIKSGLTDYSQIGKGSQRLTPPVTSAPRNRRTQPAHVNTPFAPPKQRSNAMGLGEYVLGTQALEPARRQKQAKKIGGASFPNNALSSPSRPVIDPADRLVARQLHSNDNTDIRNFFGRGRDKDIANPLVDGFSRASSAEPQSRSKRTRNSSLVNDDGQMDTDSRRVAEHFQAFAEHEDHRFKPQISTRISKPPETHHPDQSAKEMEAYFKTQEQQHSSSPSRPQKASQRQEPRIAPPHETSKKPHRLRRRTTDALERTKSSKLPLERTPDGFQIQDLILRLPASIDTIVQSSRKLDMQLNSPEWGYASESAYDVFGEPVLEKKIMEWVVTLDAMLCQRYERIDGPDARCEMHEGIQRALDTRKEVDDVAQMEVSISQDVRRAAGERIEHDVSMDVGDASGVVVQQPVVEEEKKVHDDCEFDFDMEEFVDLTGGDERQSMGIAGEADVSGIKGEFDDDIEDEMLMDL
ncbi:uncharacterized protein J4E88_004281 [Alternaria novae-zelandiae]|uniref:uncharacterized protein n=1 Tax=Alternaria novae-zelandiae TaxID=430562 RepID=UPI0020C2B9D8|nr:uncharacterized protein J4E88_004281 [Alternaria novae-zelandiae]KAI4684840.1 hypothetical protein J4E88_004281 [Alternaria novae-zelandiae]